MQQQKVRPMLLALAISILSGISIQTISLQAAAQTLNEVFNIRGSTTADGKKSQFKIDTVTDETSALLNQFKQVMKIVDDLKVYNKQQERLISSQEKEMLELNTSIDQVTIVNRQMTPLIERMIDNLEKFISLDIPFLLQERTERITFLRETLDRADVEVSEKFSQVMQAYQTENSYGSTIEAYSDIIAIAGRERQVDVLKWGRVSLVFQTPDAVVSGVWNNDKREWVTLGDEYRADIRDALRIARKTKTAEIVRLPVAAPGE